MNLPENATPYLVQTLTRLLGKAMPGSMAFIRCLPANVVRDLITDGRFAVVNWQIAAVTALTDTASRTITADVAVEWREDKADATLLLVDTESAGAGMDGIYSAAREISELELFDAAQQTVRERLPHGGKGFAQKALSKARRLARNQALSPWREFSYLCRASKSMPDLGSALPEIGLWPVFIEDKPDDDDLDKAARLTDLLLPRQGARMSAEARVEGLKLPTTDAAIGNALSIFLRESESRPRLTTLTLLESREEFWLNNLRPGVFDAQTLKEIRWVNWRGKSGKPVAWTGLVTDADNRLTLKLALEDHPQQRVRFEVRWETDPATLAKGAVEYAVEVRADQDVLAEKIISHSAKGPQKCLFTQDDFGEIEESARFEAVVVIRALVAETIRSDKFEDEDNPLRAVSEDFILCFGETAKAAKSSTGNVYPTLVLAAIQVAKDGEAFARLADSPSDKHAFSRDDKGYITCRVDGKAGRVLCPNLLLDIAFDWGLQGGLPGRWQIKVRADGSAAGKPSFIAVSTSGDQAGARFTQASRDFFGWLAKASLGPLAVLYTDRKQISDYINAAVTWWEGASPQTTLIHTLEVIAVNGRRVGLIVLPTHPLRVAWQQGFDMLAYQHRYEEGTHPAKVAKLLGALVGAQYPSMLPGFDPGEAFVFVDSLGFHAVAMAPSDDKEPKATVAMLSRLLADNDKTEGELMAPSVGKCAADQMGEEIGRYLSLHAETRRIRLHALRPGDAMPTARAIGNALRMVESTELESDELSTDSMANGKRAFELELYPADGHGTLSGRFLSATSERRRSGAGAVPEEDRWLLESVTRPGGVSLPRLAWMRRTESTPQTPAHLALAFDIFASRLEFMPTASLQGGNLEAHGLALTPERRFFSTPIPRWETAVPPNPEGEKHPTARGFSERIVKAHSVILRTVARQLGGGSDDWPVLITEVTADRGDMLTSLHSLCDWVVTVDRHAGIEYFDSPRRLERAYDAYLIDCVPARDDLGFLQLITSTSSIDEIVRLLDTALGEMGLSSSPRNCTFLLNSLKALSGRLALRLVQSGTVAQEMIALALTQTYCAEVGEDGAPWLSLKEGFFVPIDDVPELFRGVGDKKDKEESGQRADLLYVTANRKSGLRFGFVEVKFRRYLKTARSSDLLDSINSQLNASCDRWEKLFGQATEPLEKMLQRARLIRVLRFYALKGQRHTLSEEAFERIDKELSKLAREGTAYVLPGIEEQDRARVGLVFCPEYSGQTPAAIGDDVWLFGPARLPESRRTALISVDPQTSTVSNDIRSPTVASSTTEENANDAENTGLVLRTHRNPPIVELLLGQRDGNHDPVNWKISVQGNPHLMIVGLPGMGKTHCLIQLCKQLSAEGIAPIVFSYHQDIDERLGEMFGAQLQAVSFMGLGFNPLQVTGDGPLAYMDNVSMLRDNFAAIFPDLGDIQLGRIREAIKQSYVDCGWALGVRGDIPAFRSFFEILMADAKPDRGLMTRLSELADYGMFDGNADQCTELKRSHVIISS